MTPEELAVETSAYTLNRLGDNGQKWAQEFRATALRLGYSDMDEGWLIGWFADAIEHSNDVRRWHREANPNLLHDAAPDMLAALELISAGCVPIVGKLSASDMQHIAQIAINIAKAPPNTGEEKS